MAREIKIKCPYCGSEQYEDDWASTRPATWPFVAKEKRKYHVFCRDCYKEFVVESEITATIIRVRKRRRGDL